MRGIASPRVRPVGCVGMGAGPGDGATLAEVVTPPAAAAVTTGGWAAGKPGAGEVAGAGCGGTLRRGGAGAGAGASAGTGSLITSLVTTLPRTRKTSRPPPPAPAGGAWDDAGGPLGRL